MQENDLNVPIAPNESIIVGKVVTIAPNSDAGIDWTVQLEKSIAVKGKKNFSKAYVGKQIRITVAPDLPVVIKANSLIKARIMYQGYSSFGTFLLVNDEVTAISSSAQID